MLKVEADSSLDEDEEVATATRTSFPRWMPE
jgi:hypothetical protein